MSGKVEKFRTDRVTFKIHKKGGNQLLGDYGLPTNIKTRRKNTIRLYLDGKKNDTTQNIRKSCVQAPVVWNVYMRSIYF